MNKTGNWKTEVVVCSILAVLWSCAQVAQADLVFGEPTLFGPPVSSGNTEFGASLSADGLQVYYDAWPDGHTDIYVATRATTNDAWGPGLPLGPAVNSSAIEMCPRISADGLELYFERYVSSTRTDIYVARRQSPQDTWQPAARLGVSFNGSGISGMGSISADGLELCYSNSSRLCVATRPTKDSAWTESKILAPNVSGEYPAISPGGLYLLFSSSSVPGGVGKYDLWMTSRATREADWSAPVNLGPAINSPITERRPWISYDGSTVLFTGGAPSEGPRPGGRGSADVWQMKVTPVVDFNGDKKVDLVDLVMLIDNWGKNKPLCDIGPTPWGDGKVDIEDLKVFMTYYEKENPPKQP